MAKLEEILIPVDNSKYSNYCVELGLKLASAFGSKLVGNHVYAAKLHDDRFVQMEEGLPPEYQEPEELQRQRDVHDSLITQGLELISDSFLDFMEQECQKAGVPFGRKILEGKNYYQIVKDINESEYSLVLMGAFGLGALSKTLVGSVTSRVVRRSKTDVLVVKNQEGFDRKIVVCIDGSPKSFAAVRFCATLSKKFNVPLEGVSVFDPDFHITAFRSISTVLSEEAGKVFKFEEQEKLHDEIIDKGLEKIYRDHLSTAEMVAKDMGVEMQTTLLSGRAIEEIQEYVGGEDVSLVAVGRTGIHSDNGLDIGSITENLLVTLKTNLLIVTEDFVPEFGDGKEETAIEIPWSEEAEARMERIPGFVRNMARKAIVDYARSKGFKQITGDVVTEARKSMGM
ncbi:MAG: universal stress protein [Nitrospinota bacterium]